MISVVRFTLNGVRDRSRGRALPARVPARGSPADGGQEGVRGRSLRGLFRARRRGAAHLVHHPAGADRGQVDRHDRGDSRFRDGRLRARLFGGGSGPVRLLHPRHGPRGQSPPRPQRRPERGRGPRRAAAEHLPLHRVREDRRREYSLAARYRRGRPRPRSRDAGASRAGIGARRLRVDAARKIRGEARYVDDLSEPGMLFGAVLRAPHPRARLLSLDVSAARALPGVAVAATWQDIPGKRFIGSVVADWPTLIAVGEVTRCVGDAVAVVAAETPAPCARSARAHRRGVRGPGPRPLPRGSPRPRRAGDPSRGERAFPHGRQARGRRRGDRLRRARRAGRASPRPSPTTPSWSPRAPSPVLPTPTAWSSFAPGEQNVYDGRRYIADTLGLPLEKVRVVSAYVGGAYGGKEDQTVQHIAALLAWLSERPVKCTLGRAESTRVHVKRHAMTIDLALGCDERGTLVGLTERITLDTGAYASLGGPVLHRAVTHAGGPYAARTSTWKGPRCTRTTPRRERSADSAFRRSTSPSRARSMPWRRRPGSHRGRSGCATRCGPATRSPTGRWRDRTPPSRNACSP